MTVGVLVVSGLGLAGCASSNDAGTASPTTTPPAAASSQPSSGPLATASESAPSPATPADPSSASAVGVYYLGDTGRSVLLYREFHQGAETGPDPAAQAKRAVEMMLNEAPLDPDYRSGWPREARLLGLSVQGSVARVDLDPSLGSTPVPADPTMAVQQLLWTVAAAAPEVSEVEITVGGMPQPQLWGGALDGPKTKGEPLRTLAAIWLQTPVQNGTAPAGPVTLSGEATAFEGTVSWEVTAAGPGGAVIDSGFTTATVGGPQRGTFTTTVTLPAGAYVVTAFEVNQENGKRIYPDSKSFTVS